MCFCDFFKHQTTTKYVKIGSCFQEKNDSTSGYDQHQRVDVGWVDVGWIAVLEAQDEVHPGFSLFVLCLFLYVDVLSLSSLPYMRKEALLPPVLSGGEMLWRKSRR